jgi:hypothetical protein
VQQLNERQVADLRAVLTGAQQITFDRNVAAMKQRVAERGKERGVRGDRRDRGPRRRRRGPRGGGLGAACRPPAPERRPSGARATPAPRAVRGRLVAGVVRRGIIPRVTAPHHPAAGTTARAPGARCPRCGAPLGRLGDGWYCGCCGLVLPGGPARAARTPRPRRAR